MWAVVDNTPFASDRNWVRDKHGRHHWIVAVRASFEIAPDGTLNVAAEQPNATLLPAYRGEPGRSSLLRDSDLGPLKPGTDVLVEGSARAPRGEFVTELPVALTIAGMRKVLLVVGDNEFRPGITGLTTTRPRPFELMPLIYERAFGGSDLESDDPARRIVDSRNPVGVGVAARSKHLVGQPGPNVLYPGAAADLAGPAGFGPIASDWSPRRELGGTYDAAWFRDRRPLLPLDYDERHGCCAPADQHLGRHLQPGERIQVVNMTPEGVLEFVIPDLKFGFTTRFGRKQIDHAAHLATVTIETEHRRASLVWQTSLLVSSHEIDGLDETRIELR